MNLGACTKTKKTEVVVVLTDIGISLRCTVELSYPWNCKSLGELLPDLWTEAVTKHNLHPMLFLFRSFGSRQEITANLSDVLGALQGKRS